MDRRNSLMDYYTTADVLKTPINRGGVLPLTEYADRAEWDMSSGLPGMIAQFFTAPGRAYRGEITDDQMIPEAMNFAGMVAGGGAAASSTTPARNALLFANGKNAAAPGAVMSEAGRLADAQKKTLGFNAFHGSPHDFDRFSSEHIGKGEGAQSYGHGLYFADRENVAKMYRDKLTDRTNFLRPDGTQWNADGLEHLNVRALARKGDLDAAIAKADEIAATDSPVAAMAARDATALRQIQSSGGIAPNPGHMYEVRINADPINDFLDWDKPLSQQSEKVRGALSSADLIPYTVVDNAGNRLDFSRGMTRSEAEKFAEARGGVVKVKHDADFDAVRKAQMGTGRGEGAQADVSNTLREAGIPGIRYLDQGSRGAGEGSSNYVVFDDSLIEILRKYGLLPPVAAGALATATSDGEVY
ncbi:MAG: hypothetical protein KDK08_24600 [Rhizobiaceae bacterium]|nr:hypothetical protein [Rhizobiaceae bacterium]